MRPLSLLLSLVLLLAGSTLAAEPPRFLRLERAADGAPRALEAAIARYRRDDGVRVDLVAAVHVGDPAYYRALDTRLAGYEVVLYELVGDPDGVEAAPPDAMLSLAGALQGGMKDLLGLSHQLDEIDYGRANMVHADLTQAEFSASMRERGESLLQPLLRAWAVSGSSAGRAMAARQQADLFRALLATDRRRALRRLLAGQLVDQAFLELVLSGPEGSTLIEVRNQRALEELARQLGAGAREVAIFYGAGHMPDLARRLGAEHGFEAAGVEWLQAWDLD